jgi:hypothetical protein
VIEGSGACHALTAMLQNPQSVGIMNYGRYWHGYQILSKPFLRFSDIRDLRYILACLTIGAVFIYSTIIATALTGATAGPINGLWFGLGYLMLTDGADLANVFTQTLSLLTIFALPIAIFWAIKAKVRWSLLLLAVAVGSVNSFFDLLFNPPLGLSTLAIAVIAALAGEKLSVRGIARITATLALGWAIGFFGTYVCRFAIDVLLSDSPFATLQGIITAGLFRISGTEDKIKQVVFWATIKNFGYPMLRPSFAVFVVITGIYAIVLRARGYRLAPRPVLSILLAPCLISALWFEIFRNHSQHHHWFTYRSASFSLVCLAAALMFCLSKEKGHGEVVVAQPGELNV